MKKLIKFLTEVRQPDGWSILEALVFLVIMSPFLWLIWYTS